MDVVYTPLEATFTLVSGIGLIMTGILASRTFAKEMWLSEVWDLDPFIPKNIVVLKRKTFVMQFVTASLVLCQFGRFTLLSTRLCYSTD